MFYLSFKENVSITYNSIPLYLQMQHMSSQLSPTILWLIEQKKKTLIMAHQTNRLIEYDVVHVPQML